MLSFPEVIWDDLLQLSNLLQSWSFFNILRVQEKKEIKVGARLNFHAYFLFACFSRLFYFIRKVYIKDNCLEVRQLTSCCSHAPVWAVILIWSRAVCKTLGNILSITVIKLDLFRVHVISCFRLYTVISKTRCYSSPSSWFENDIGVGICIKQSWWHKCMSLNCLTAVTRTYLPLIENYYFRTAFCSNELSVRDSFAVHLGYDRCDLNTKLTGSTVHIVFTLFERSN